jgi:hypothetical protein
MLRRRTTRHNRGGFLVSSFESAGREALMTKFSNSFVHNLIETLVRPMGTECLAECRRHGRLSFGDALPGLAAGILSSEYFFPSLRTGPSSQRCETAFLLGRDRAGRQGWEKSGRLA